LIKLSGVSGIVKIIAPLPARDSRELPYALTAVIFE